MTKITICLLFSILTFTSYSMAQVPNPLTGNDYEECLQYAVECTYTPSKKDLDTLIEKVMRSVGNVKAGTFTDPHHLGPLKGEPADPDYVATYIESHDGVIEFASSSQKCKLGNQKNVSCRDLIEYWLIQYDREKKLKNRRTFDVRVVIYEYNTRKENGYRLGFSGQSGSDSTSGGVLAPRASLTDNSAEDFLGSLFTLNLGRLASDILSLNLNLGNLGNYLSTYNSYTFELKAESFRNISLEVEKEYANVVSPENVNEDVGMFFSGEITPDSEDSNRIRIERGGFRFGRLADPSNESETSFSLTKQIDLTGFTGFDLDMELGKPKMLFDINTVELSKERSRGLLFFNKIEVGEHINLVGVIYVTEEKLKQTPTMANSFTEEVSDLNFENIFSSNSLELYYDPILAEVLETNIEDLNKKTDGTASFGYKVKPYRLKLNPRQPIPARYLGQMVRIKTSSNSPVNVMGQTGEEVVSLRRLVEEGYHLGLEPKNNLVQINPLEFKLEITLDQINLFDESSWTRAPNSNQVIFNMVHYATSTSSDSMKIWLDTYNHIPWRR